MKKAFVFYALFQDPKDESYFIARVLDNTTNPDSWRIDNHDKTYFLALKETYVRDCTPEETTMHINRPNPNR
jgi:hypothetical protein